MVFLAKRVKRAITVGLQDYQVQWGRRAIMEGLQDHQAQWGRRAIMVGLQAYQELMADMVCRAYRACQADQVQQVQKATLVSLGKMHRSQVNASSQFATAKVLHSFIHHINTADSPF